MKKLLIALFTVLLILIFIGIGLFFNFSNISNLNNSGPLINIDLTADAELDHLSDLNRFVVLKREYRTFNNQTKTNIFYQLPNLEVEVVSSDDISIESTHFVLTKNTQIVIESSSIEEINQFLSENLTDDIYLLDVSVDYRYYLVKGTYSESYELVLDYPIEFIFDTTELAKGDFATIKTKNANQGEAIIVSSPLERFSLQFYPDGDEMIGFLPIDYRNDLGTYCVNINNNCFEIEVIDKDFREIHFNIDYSTLAVTSTKEAYAEYNREVPAALASNPESRMYEETFIVPTTGRLSSDFLDTRYINGSKTPSSYHSGIDIANDYGTEVYATASGKVVFAKELMVTGNTVIIYHGNNIYSFYLHLDEINTEVDSKITQGAILGKMGSTGMSTGSHLHFGIRIGNNYVNPWYFIEDDNNGQIYE